MTDIDLPYFSARPASEPPWPGIVVIHEGGGISGQLLRVCERFASEGYATIAPDLFFRAGGPEASDFMTLIQSLDDRTPADIAKARAHLRNSGAHSVGITGFCMGGMLTYRTAISTPGFDAAVGFYGGGIVPSLGEPLCPTQLFFGGTDEYIPPADIEAVVAHHPTTIVYPNAGHGFMRDGSASYDEAAATDAWARTLTFFGEHLRRA